MMCAGFVVVGDQDDDIGMGGGIDAGRMVGMPAFLRPCPRFRLAALHGSDFGFLHQQVAEDFINCWNSLISHSWK